MYYISLLNGLGNGAKVNDNQDEKGFEPEEQPGRKVRIQQQRRLTWREEGGVGAILSPSTSATGIRISQASNTI